MLPDQLEIASLALALSERDVVPTLKKNLERIYLTVLILQFSVSTALLYSSASLIYSFQNSSGFPELQRRVKYSTPPLSDLQLNTEVDTMSSNLLDDVAELGSEEDEDFDEETGEVRNRANGTSGMIDDSSEEEEDDDDEEAAAAVSQSQFEKVITGLTHTF